MTGGRARVFLSFLGLTGESHRSESFEIALKITEGDEVKKFTLYRQGDLVPSSEKYSGYSPNLVLSLDELEAFYSALQSYYPMTRKLNVSGQLMTLRNDEGRRRIISSSLKWATSQYNFAVNTLDAISQSGGNLSDIVLEADIFSSSDLKVGKFNLFAENLNEGDQSLAADIQMNFKDGVE